MRPVDWFDNNGICKFVDVRIYRRRKKRLFVQEDHVLICYQYKFIINADSRQIGESGYWADKSVARSVYNVGEKWIKPDTFMINYLLNPLREW